MDTTREPAQLTLDDFTARYDEVRNIFFHYVMRSPPARRKRIEACCRIKSWDVEDILSAVVCTLCRRLQKGPINCRLSTAVCNSTLYLTGAVITKDRQANRPFVMTSSMQPEDEDNPFAEPEWEPHDPGSDWDTEWSMVNATLPTLKPREREFLALHWGLDGKQVHTFREIAELHGITRERARQIVDVAMTRIALQVLGRRTMHKDREVA